ncbi:hypothetical protein K470DRAFT_262923 [Piedraia hortae CBS 480.64]|uniref:AMP-activated protein kinase glycogen-binding domain-containing protein n=1 Tax=Piedraia hortae CBS 480.64 TaxID=1314780 RepID=A0A6A7C4G4_9PEZI|nr:hypothetical protein K470DRAFT_262923 [Piedraia hortae CBS 480.64]
MQQVRIEYTSPKLAPPVYIFTSLSSPPWTPVEMDREVMANGENCFYKVFKAKPGVHQYKFRLGPGDWWVLDGAKPTIEDEAGNRNNMLIVKGSGYVRTSSDDAPLFPYEAGPQPENTHDDDANAEETQAPLLPHECASPLKRLGSYDGEDSPSSESVVRCASEGRLWSTQSQRNSRRGSSDYQNFDPNDPTLLSFPQTREGIMATLERVSSRDSETVNRRPSANVSLRSLPSVLEDCEAEAKDTWQSQVRPAVLITPPMTPDDAKSVRTSEREAKRRVSDADIQLTTQSGPEKAAVAGETRLSRLGLTLSQPYVMLALGGAAVAVAVGLWKLRL